MNCGVGKIFKTPVRVQTFVVRGIRKVPRLKILQKLNFSKHRIEAKRGRRSFELRARSAFCSQLHLTDLKKTLLFRSSKELKRCIVESVTNCTP